LLQLLLGTNKKVEINAIVGREVDDQGKPLTLKLHNHHMYIERGNKPNAFILGSTDNEPPGVRADGYAYDNSTRTTIKPDGSISHHRRQNIKLKPDGERDWAYSLRLQPLDMVEIARPALHAWHALNIEGSHVKVTPAEGGKKLKFALHGDGAWENLPRHIQQGYKGLIDIYWGFLNSLKTSS
jgi:hypothetical protein